MRQHLLATAAFLFAATVCGAQVRRRPLPPVRQLPPVRPVPPQQRTSGKQTALGGRFAYRTAISPDIALLAGTLPAPLGQVRLRWVVTAGWVARGQRWNLYREVNGVRQGPLNSAPLVFVDPNMGTSSAYRRMTQLHPPTYKGFSLPSLVASAFKPVAGMTDRQIYSIKPSGIQVASAAAAFNALKLGIRQQDAVKPPMIPPSQFVAIARKQAAVSQILRLTAPIANRGGVMHTLAFHPGTVAAEVQTARAALTVGILARPGVASVLGTEFTDTTPNRTGPSTYVLTFVGPDGKEMEMARATLTVGQDPMPGVPSGLDSMQVGVNTVALYWKPPTDDETKRYFLPTYNVYRIDPADPNGKLLTPSPVAKAALHATTGSAEVESLYSFVDSSAPLGSCTYKVTTVDGLGRESASGALSAASVEDWATPPAVTAVGSIRRLGAGPRVPGVPTIVFLSDGDAQAKYHVYRQTMDGAAAAPVLVKVLGPESLSGRAVSFTDSSAARDHTYRYFVCAYYPRNNRDSLPAVSGNYPVPTLNGPAAASGLAAQIALVTRPPFATHLFGMVRSRVGALATAATLVREATPRVPARNLAIRRPVVGAKSVGNVRFVGRSAFVTPTYGAMVTLNWQEGTHEGLPITYQVYRVNVTPAPPQNHVIPLHEQILRGYRLSRAIGPAAGKISAGSDSRRISVAGQLRTGGPGGIRRIGASGASGSTGSLQAGAPMNRLTFNPAIRSVFAKLTMLAAEPVLVGQVTGKTTLETGVIPNADGQDFLYYVVPMNRWGQSGPASASLKVHVGPTIAPATPHLMYAAAAADRAQVELHVIPPAPEKEVVTFHVFRLDLGVRQLPAITTPGGGGGTTTSVSSGRLRRRTVAHPIGETITTQRRPIAPVQRKQKSVTFSGGTSLSKVAAELRTGNLAMYATLLGQIENPAAYAEVPASQLAVANVAGMVQIVDKSTVASHAYAYRIIVENSNKLRSGYSAYLDASTASSLAKAPTLGQPSATPAGVKIPVTAGSGVIVLERSLGSTGVWIQVETESGTTSLSDPGPVQGQTYSYRARLIDPYGNVSAYSTVVKITYIAP